MFLSVSDDIYEAADCRTMNHCDVVTHTLLCSSSTWFDDFQFFSETKRNEITSSLFLGIRA